MPRPLPLCLLFCLVAAACAPGQRDVMAPGPADAAVTGPLDTVTLITPDYAPVQRLLVAGMGMEETEARAPAPPMAEVQRRLWGVPAGRVWETRLLTRPGVAGTTKVRILIMEDASDAPRNSWNRQQLGPYGMGFPTLDVFAWDEHLRGLGFERATPEVEVFDVAAPDGSRYPVHESAFFGPEYLRVIAISRKGGLPQVGVYDEETGRGGPVYATQIVPDMDAMIRFFTQVLDMEVRSDRVWKEYPEPFRFVLVHAKGSSTGHIALVEYEAEYVVPGTGVPPRPPARGMSMWTFRVTDIEAIRARAELLGTTVLHGPAEYEWGGRNVTSLTLIAPNGFLIELIN